VLASQYLRWLVDGSLFSEFATLYQAFLDRSALALPALSLQYADYGPSGSGSGSMIGAGLSVELLAQPTR